MKCSALIAAVSLLALASSSWASPQDDKATSNAPAPRAEAAIQATTQGNPLARKLMLAEDNTAQCLTQCKKEFDSCSNGGKDNIPACIKKRTDCYNKCGSGK